MMLDIVKNARQQHKAMIEMMYEDTCTIIEYQSTKDPITKITKKQEVTVFENQPCKLSFSSVKNANTSEIATTVTQVVKLILSNNVDIKAGSKIIVNHNDKEFIYKNSGEANVFFTHQEISLELFKEWT